MSICNKKIIMCVIILFIFIVTICFGVFFNTKMKSITTFSNNEEYILGGQIVGVKLLASGVLVMGVDREDIDIKVGDIILEVNGQKIETDEELKKFANEAETLELKIQRHGSVFKRSIVPEYSNNSREYKLGLWVKDSSAGVLIFLK